MRSREKLDGMALGHKAIDIKTLMKDSGYVVPQVSMAKLPEMPAVVTAALAEIKASQEAYQLGEKVKVFVCKVCGARCSAQEKIEVSTGTHFYVCGNCDIVEEVL